MSIDIARHRQDATDLGFECNIGIDAAEFLALLDEVERLRKGIDPWRRICARQTERIAQLEAALRAADKFIMGITQDGRIDLSHEHTVRLGIARVMVQDSLANKDQGK